MAEAFWRKGMLDSLDMTSEKRQLKIDKRRVPVNEQIFHLIIGLGGTGIDALLECNEAAEK